MLYLQTFLSDYGMMWVGETSAEDEEVYNEEPLEESPGPLTSGVWLPGIYSNFLMQ